MTNYSLDAVKMQAGKAKFRDRGRLLDVEKELLHAEYGA
jgi:hypothetical protein